MGCDIWTRVEMLDKSSDWISIDYYTIREDWESRKDEYKTFPFFPVRIYDGRDYELFSVLAGVRGMYHPIVEPRGIPESSNKYIKDEFESCDCWHTPSWLTLGELRKYYYAHRDDEPLKDEDGFDNVYVRLLNGIIKPIEQRLADLYYVFADSDEELEEKCRKYWDRVRMVFWFDN